MYEEDILKELKKVRELLETLIYAKDYGGVNLADCLERIMYGVEE